MLHRELVPAREKNSRRLMVMLHGLGDSIEGYRWLPEALDLPWLNFLLVNAPDEYFGGYSWFDYPDNLAPGIRRSPSGDDAHRTDQRCRLAIHRTWELLWNVVLNAAFLRYDDRTAGQLTQMICVRVR